MKSLVEEEYAFIVSDEKTSIEDLKGKDEERIFKQNEDYLNETLNDLQLRRFKQNTDSRWVLTLWAMVLVTWWLIELNHIVKMNSSKYFISDNVMMTLLGTSTVNVLGLVLVVMYDLFGKGKTQNR